MDLYRPAKGRRVPLPGSNQDWPATGLPADLANPYVARLVRDGDLEVVETSGQKKGRNPAGDEA